MAENINPNYDPANSEVTGKLYNTQIPELADDANIQDALKLYHYGTTTAPATNADIIAGSVAGHLKQLKTEVTALQSRGIGSSFNASEPSSVENGYIWVDSDSVAPVFDTDSLSAVYSPIEPADNLNDGMLWVNSSTSELSVWSGSEWQSITAGGITAKQFSITDMSGLGTDITGYDATTAAALGLNTTVFGYLDGVTPTPLSVSIVATTYTKVEVEFNFGYQSSVSGAGDIYILRVVNGDFDAAALISKVRFYSASPPQIKFVDTHGQSVGSVVSYVISNGGPETIVFDGDYTIQAIAREVA